MSHLHSVQKYNKWEDLLKNANILVWLPTVEKTPVPYKSKIVTFNYEQAKGPFKNSYHNKVSK